MSDIENRRQRKPIGQKRMDNPETLAQDKDNKKHNIEN